MKRQILIIFCILTIALITLIDGKGKKGKSGSRSGERRRPAEWCDYDYGSRGKSKSRERCRIRPTRPKSEETSREEYEFDNPCSTGEPAKASRGGILYCSRSTLACPPSFWCHVGEDRESTVCCPESSDPCTQPKAPGSGEARLTRWYFEQSSKHCLQFAYSGKGGNQNNFLTAADCEIRCPREAAFMNPCSAGQPYRDPSTLAIKFCNANVPTDCPDQYHCHTGADVKTTACCPGGDDPCTLPLAQGQGSSILLRWYFGRTTGTCQQFTYTGLKGNANNFMSQGDCQRNCPQDKSTTASTPTAIESTTSTTTPQSTTPSTTPTTIESTTPTTTTSTTETTTPSTTPTTTETTTSTTTEYTTTSRTSTSTTSESTESEETDEDCDGDDCDADDGGGGDTNQSINQNIDQSVKVSGDGIEANQSIDQSISQSNKQRDQSMSRRNKKKCGKGKKRRNGKCVDRVNQSIDQDINQSADGGGGNQGINQSIRQNINQEA